ncbi:MAG: GntR family transcriptional regulator [Ktedonobacteraceae bacterium]|nr:GntR family transcriptional regulator [Ktedonobacteraceae bacterium]MBV8822850.1 GntR family transcriptional regulator [Ktedonobacteraceae bacterium]MBV9021763.1 GntR family transcriptional regulator [Ktedonobacteraceae bacterium]
MELGKAEEIAQTLRARIMQGILPEGTKTASERDLSEEFGASRMTVRRAIDIIEGEGLVVRLPGRGTFVARLRDRVVVDRGREVREAVEGYPMPSREQRMSDSFLKDIECLGPNSRVQFLEQPSLVAADKETAQHLQIPIGTLVLKRYQLHLVDGLPHCLIESYYPSDLFGELLTTDIGDEPLFVWLHERHHLSVAHTQEVLIARLATQSERRLLRISSKAPVVVLNRKVWTEEKRPVEWAHIIAVAALYTFTYEYDIAKRHRPTP